METETEMTVFPESTGNLCRVCLATNQNNQNILGAKWNDSDSTDTLDLAEKFRLCSGVEVSLVFKPVPFTSIRLFFYLLIKVFYG